MSYRIDWKLKKKTAKNVIYLYLCFSSFEFRQFHACFSFCFVCLIVRYSIYKEKINLKIVIHYSIAIIFIDYLNNGNRNKIIDLLFSFAPSKLLTSICFSVKLVCCFFFCEILNHFCFFRLTLCRQNSISLIN